MKISFLSGAGGTGKTTLLKALCEVTPNLKILHLDDLVPESQVVEGAWYLFPSQTRSYYATLGVKNEIEYSGLALEEAKRKFQLQIQDLYVRDTLQVIRTLARNGGNLVSERSLLDHVAYYNAEFNKPLKRPQTSGELDEGSDVIMEGFSSISTFMKELEGHEVRYFRAPYPPPWDLSSGEDGFRRVDMEKNIRWDQGILDIAHFVLNVPITSLDMTKTEECISSLLYLD